MSLNKLMGFLTFKKPNKIISYIKSPLIRIILSIRGRMTSPQLKMLYAFDQHTLLCSTALNPDYYLINYTLGKEEQWIQMLNDSQEFGVWNIDRLSQEILSCLLPAGGIFVMAGDKIVASAAACRIPQFSPNATLMYVVVLPEHRSQGLGQAVTLAALSACQLAGYPGMALCTDDHRLAAIKTYLKIGFVPTIGLDTKVKQRWATVLSSMPIPTHKSKQTKCH